MATAVKEPAAKAKVITESIPVENNVFSIFELRKDRDTYTEVIHHLEYMPNKNEPDNEDRGTYLVFVMSDGAENVAFTLPVGVVHKMARANRVFYALRSIIGTEVQVQFFAKGEEPVNTKGDAMFPGPVDKDNYYTSGVKLTFSDYMNQKAAELDRGIASSNNSGFKIERGETKSLPRK